MPVDDRPSGTLYRAAALGFITGLRTFTPIAALLALDRTKPVAPHRAPSLAAKLGAGALAAGELVGDKLPFTPARTSAPQLAGRIVMGAITASLFSQRRGAWLVGAGAALAGTFAGYHARRALVKRGLGDTYVAVAEDLLAITSSAWTVRGRSALVPLR